MIGRGATAILVALLAFSPSAATSATATSAPPRRLVVLVEPPIGTAPHAQALARIRGELQAIGFDVVTTPSGAAGDARADVEAAASRHEAVAALSIVPGSEGPEVWVADRVHGTTTAQIVAAKRAPGGLSAPMLAFSAVEFLRTSLADLWPEPAGREPPRPAPEIVRAASTEAREPHAPPAWYLAGSGRYLVRPRAFVWGFAVGRDRMLSQRLSLGMQMGGDFGTARFEGGSVSIAGVSAAASLVLCFGAGPLSGHIGAGARAGIMRLAPVVIDPANFATEVGLGPWVGPFLAAGVRLGAATRAAVRFGLGIEVGYAAAGTRGLLADERSLSFSGGWAAAQLGGWF